MNPLVDGQRRSATTARLNGESPHVPKETPPEVYVGKKETHEIASGHRDIGEALQEHE